MPVDRTAQQVEYQSALIDRERRRRETETLERQIADNVKQVGPGARSAGAQRGGRRKPASTSSRREVEVAQLRYENGLSNNLDVVTAEAGLLQAEGRRIQALADSAVARAAAARRARRFQSADRHVGLDERARVGV